MRRSRFENPRLVYDPDVGAYRAIDPPAPPTPVTLEEKRAKGQATVAQLLSREFGQVLRSTGATAGVRVPKHLRDYVTPGVSRT